MIKLVYFWIFFLFANYCFAQTNSKHVYVEPYTRKDGTFVEGHYRTAPNSTNVDNFSTKGNVNPYTGAPGYIPPDNGYLKASDNSGYSNTYYTPAPGYNSSSSTSVNYTGTTNMWGEKVIEYNNGREVFGLCNTPGSVVYDDKKDYYWYTSYSGIQKTKGASGGTLLNGEYKFYGKTGQLLVKANYKNGLENGEYMSWEESGEIKEKANYTNGIPTYIKFKNEDGYWIEWTNGILEKGSTKKVYTSGGNLIESALIDEKLMFHYKIYYEWSEKIKEEYTWGVGDFYDGPYKEFYENGNPKLLGQFEDNFQVGDWKFFDSDSSLTEIDKYKLVKEYNSTTGKLKAKGSKYLIDKANNTWAKDGKWIIYKENGKEWEEVKYYKFGIEVEAQKEK
jgi:antitoxin component YwqK of YwqJK toxin-antitoxin module